MKYNEGHVVKEHISKLYSHAGKFSAETNTAMLYESCYTTMSELCLASKQSKI